MLTILLKFVVFSRLILAEVANSNEDSVRSQTSMRYTVSLVQEQCLKKSDRYSDGTGWFWHVTDFHWDFTYFDRGLSCYDTPKNPPKYGNDWCDSPWILIEESVEAMRKIRPNVDFIFWTGDNVMHADDKYFNFEIHDAILGNITNLLKEKFPTVPVYATFGNHDYYPHNQFPPHGNLLYNKTYEKWKNWIDDPSQISPFLKGGYYTIKTKQGIRIIGLNTNLYYTSDKVTANLTDPADQFVWLDRILSQAKSNNEKVIITAHIAPGIVSPNTKRWMYPQYHTRLNNLFIKYHDVIVGMHFGHEHLDMFRVYFQNGKPILTQFCAPSITPWRYKGKTFTEHPHNPGVRLVKYDRNTGRHLDLEQYYFDLKAANRNEENYWKLAYKASRDFGTGDIMPKSMGNLLTRMFVKGSKEFKDFLRWKSVGAVDDEVCEDINCRFPLLCSMRYLELEEVFRCIDDMKATSSAFDIGHSTLIKSLIVLVINGLLFYLTH